MKEISRRDFLTTIAGTSGYLILKSNPAFSFPGFFDNRNALALPSDSGLLGVLDPSGPFTMYARETRHQILPSKDTQLWAYETETGGKQYINPIIRIKKGETFRTVLENELPESTIIHWHGLHVDHQNDGHPGEQIQPLEEYPYEFSIQKRAATYWYHTHAHRRTAVQAYYGLAGLFIVEDEDERRLTDSLDLNFGETDIPLIIQDKTFGSSGDLIYTQNPMGAMNGFLGNTILANLTSRPYLNVSSRIYRIRILNASNARIYRLAFSNSRTNMPFYLIGTDGGLLTTPQQVTEAFLAPGERIDVLLDLSRAHLGETVWLKSLRFSGADDCSMMGSGGMMGGGMGQCGNLPNGSQFPILKLTVTRRIPFDKKVPSELSSIAPIDTSDAETRRFTLSFSMMRWLINGLSFDMDYVPVTVTRGSTEIWEITNPLTSRGMGMTGMMNMPHPMHIHGFQFQVLQRLNSPYQVRRLALDDNGVLPTDMGLKDTVLVWPGENVRIAIDFSHNFPGSQLYLLHCHILEHEDNGMMMNYEVV